MYTYKYTAPYNLHNNAEDLDIETNASTKLDYEIPEIKKIIEEFYDINSHELLKQIFTQEDEFKTKYKIEHFTYDKTIAKKEFGGRLNYHNHDVNIVLKLENKLVLQHQFNRSFRPFLTEAFKVVYELERIFLQTEKYKTESICSYWQFFLNSLVQIINNIKKLEKQHSSQIKKVCNIDKDDDIYKISICIRDCKKHYIDQQNRFIAFIALNKNNMIVIEIETEHLIKPLKKHKIKAAVKSSNK